MENIDVVIITAIPDIELLTMLRAFNVDPKRENELSDGGRYWFSNLSSNKMKKNLKVVITCIGSPGNLTSSSVTTRFIQNFHPKLLILSGIAAGIKQKLNLLDIVVSDKVIGYESGRLTPAGLRPRHNVECPPYQIQQDIRFFNNNINNAEFLDFFNRLQSKLTAEQRPHGVTKFNPKVFVGTIVSGEKLIADGSLQKLRSKYDEKILAGEMEGIGFATAAKMNESTPWIIIRGISDFGDPRSKDGKYKDEYHFSAANSAASYVKYFLEYCYSGEIKLRSEKKGRTFAIGKIDPKIRVQILEKIKDFIASHGLDDSNWAKAISSQYFLIGLAECLNMKGQPDYKELLNIFLRSFHPTVDDKIDLLQDHILVTPEELDKIIDCMKEEDKADQYFLKSQKTKAENINASQLHYNYLYGLIIKIASNKKSKVLDTINKLAIDELTDPKVLDDYGGWQPYRIPWITARILISLKDSNYFKRKDAKIIDSIIIKALDSLIRRIADRKYWRSGVGIWVSKWESTALCLEALDKWQYVDKNKKRISEILSYIFSNETEWMVSPNFDTEEHSNHTLAATILICSVVHIIKNNFKSNEFIVDYNKYINYLDECIDTIIRTSKHNNRQFCTIPQISYYIVNVLKDLN
jgi:nucleoside phosphorylase